MLALDLGVRAPSLSVGPTGTMRRLWEGITDSDIEIGDPAFDHGFSVRSPSPGFAREVLQPGVVEVVCDHPTLAWRFEGDAMLVTTPGELDPEVVESRLRFMAAVLDRIPPHAWDRHRGEPR